MAALKDILPPVKSTSATFYDHSKDTWFKDRYSGSAAADGDRSAAVKPKPVPPYGKRSGFVPGSLRTSATAGPSRRSMWRSIPLGWAAGTRRAGPRYFRSPSMPRARSGSMLSSSRARTPRRSFIRSTGTSSRRSSRSRRQLSAPKPRLKKSSMPGLAPPSRRTSQHSRRSPSSSSTSHHSSRRPSTLARRKESSGWWRCPLIRWSLQNLSTSEFLRRQGPPVPVMHSPPRPVTVKDQQDWKIPPCISNWKNPKGYTIPLDKRLAADGRGLQEVQINDNFAKLSEALYVAEQKAREAVAMRSKVQRELMMKEKERKEQELRALAQRARSERTGIAPAPTAAAAPSAGIMMEDDDDMSVERIERPVKETKEEREQRLEREKIREERRRERERERRLEAKEAAMGRKSKTTRDRDRDVSEKVALGMASTGEGRAGEVMYDQRLFNQDKGMDSGLLRTITQPTLSTLYRPKKDADGDMYGGADEQLEKVLKTERFKPDKAFSGTSDKASGSKRERPVEFERQEENDPFGLDEFLTEVKKGKKAMEKIGSGGTMKASGGGSSFREDYEGGGSGRTRVAFERGGR
ncbi:unnamed protein product [Spirodela intermedia]|uniref:SKI-interacting protein SKIP SNW domain-containing protein n=1 Tax=Spirodela intermedia TaxID=51605 RepID=A0A7I8IQM8_SPIIN|nr:unnamed protein product [Spirodela intermedia]CAA6659836.1 unnamed protein product [Spirodela intermedia]